MDVDSWNQKSKTFVQSFFLTLLDRDGRRLLLYRNQEGGSLIGWLLTVATNHTYEFLRRQKKLPSFWREYDENEQSNLETLPDSSSLSPRMMAIENERLSQLEESLDLLSERDQMVCMYYYRDERSREEIAALLKLEPNHIDQILFRIRKKIAETLRKKNIVR